ncbi:3-ketoacyl-CoA thiolase [Peziza echinospora]|nr:3-ketoacyl-CoA thiolase [Peziza echinospora]
MAYRPISTLRGISHILTKQPNDVVIVSAVRTPITKSHKGLLKDTYPEQLLTHIFRPLTSHQTPNDTLSLPSLIEDIHIGCTLSELGGAKTGRMAALHSGITVSSGFLSVNRACSSGLQAIIGISQSIRLGQIDVGIGGGVESMTRNYGNRALPTVVWPELLDTTSPITVATNSSHGVMPMGLTSENVAKRYGVTREAQDAFAVRSHTLAHRAQERGDFDAEIVPVACDFTPPSPKSDPQEIQQPLKVTVAKDDGIRPETTLTSLGRLPPAFHPQGTSTAGNSSQISDGAAGCLLMSRSLAESLNLRPLGRFISSSVVGCPPDEMGIGPMLAIPKLLKQTGLSKEEVDVWEINEAFASQAVYCVRELGLEDMLEVSGKSARGVVNPNGGAIAMGHPLGATGAKLVVSMMYELGRRKRKGLTVNADAQGQGVGVVSMCIGAGQGMAAMFVGE